MSDGPQQSIDVTARSFGHVVCGIDGSPASLEAARQASVLARPGATIKLLAAVDPLGELWDSPPYGALATAARVQRRAEQALERARATIASEELEVEADVVEGRVAETLLSRVAADRECLLAVGAGARDRISGILFGATVTEVLHESPCAVLVARDSVEGEAFPRTVVVGLDGSPQSAAAFAAARTLAERLEASLQPVVALGGKGVDLEAVQEILQGRRFKADDRVPAAALSSDPGELLVVGSRGLHGLAALGSVSEQVAHRAAGSVLVVRPA